MDCIPKQEITTNNDHKVEPNGSLAAAISCEYAPTDGDGETNGNIGAGANSNGTTGSGAGGLAATDNCGAVATGSSCCISC